MEKRLILLIILFLTACQNKKTVACSLGLEDKNINIDISAINDDISSIKVRSSFIIPTPILTDKDKYEFIQKQLDNTFHFEDNKLIREYDIEIDDVYSLDKTIKYLNSKRYYCE